MTPRDMKRLRETFRKADFGRKCPDVTVNGDDLEVMLLPENNETVLVIPYNEEGEGVMLTVNNATLKRWRVECQQATRLMRRVANGEGNDAYVDQVPAGKGFRRGRA